MKTLAGISLVLSVVTAGCGSGTNGTDAKRAHGPDESALISDQGHNDGIAGFFFLSPTVSQAPTSFTGLFDPSAAATARVCAGTGPCTDKSAMAVFTRGGGTGGGPLAKINVNTTLQRYTAVWDTKQCATGGCALTPGAAYRLHVSAVNMANTEVELGFADLQVVAKPPAPPVVTSGFSLLVKDLPYTDCVPHREMRDRRLRAHARGGVPAPRLGRKHGEYRGGARIRGPASRRETSRSACRYQWLLATRQRPALYDCVPHREMRDGCLRCH